MSGYVQIGQTALRDPLTGEFLPAVPLFIRESDAAAAAPLEEINVAQVFTETFRQYRDGCKKEGVNVK